MATLLTRVTRPVIVHHTDAYIPEGDETQGSTGPTGYLVTVDGPAHLDNGKKSQRYELDEVATVTIDDGYIFVSGTVEGGSDIQSLPAQFTVSRPLRITIVGTQHVELASPVDGAEITSEVMADDQWYDCWWKNSEGNYKDDIGIPAGVTMTSVDLDAPLTCDKDGATCQLRVNLDGSLEAMTGGGKYSFHATGTYNATYHFSNGSTVEDTGTVNIHRTND